MLNTSKKLFNKSNSNQYTPLLPSETASVPEKNIIIQKINNTVEYLKKFKK